MELLSLSIGLLLGAPLVYLVFSKRPLVRKWVERFVGITMVSILLFHVIPESVQTVGPSVLLASGFGFIFIILAEKLPAFSRFGLHHFALLLAFAGLALHTGIDGLAFFMPDLQVHQGHGHTEATGAALAWVVILHRLPEGMFVWSHLKRKSSAIIAYAVLVGMSVSTLAGFFAGEQIYAFKGFETNFAWIQAFVAGSLLHVVLDPWLHKHDCHGDDHKNELTPAHA